MDNLSSEILLKTIGTSVILLILSAHSSISKDDSAHNASSEVKVRAVFIDCKLNEKQLQYGTETSRFQREELFKHNCLQDCKQKLALTIKMSSASDQSLSDEYIPIEHVFDGSNRRVRLLNPYILRLRREPPYEMYKLRKLGTFNCLFSTSNGKNYKMQRKNTMKHGTRNSEEVPFVLKPESVQMELNPGENSTNWQRKKRFEMTETQRKLLEDSVPIWSKNDFYYQHFNNDEMIERFALPTTVEFNWDPIDDRYNSKQKPNKYKTKLNNNNDVLDNEAVIINDSGNIKDNINIINDEKTKLSERKIANNEPDDDAFHFDDSNFAIEKPFRKFDRSIKGNTRLENFLQYLDGTVKEFVLYEIDKPNIWFRTQVQVLEKLSTPEGKTKWRDISKRGLLWVTSRSPDWSSKDLNIRYRCAESTAREDFTLPSTAICLLLPGERRANNNFDNGQSVQFLIVPFEDIQGERREDLMNPEKDSYANASSSREDLRTVQVRMSRALVGTNEDEYVIVNEGFDKYLKMPYRQSHHAQIEIEAKADENQLVYVGTSGRLTTAVSESIRPARSTLIVQVTNTGLAAARFRPKVRECGQEVPGNGNDDAFRMDTDLILIPPMHTRKFRLEIPVDIPDSGTMCSVVLLNAKDESIAVRDVRVKRDDRCFCVWHCQCVCLNEDPKLLCQDMAEYHQIAAGLSPRDRPRPVRAACCPDVITLNLLIAVTGVIFFLLFLGLVKACVGLFLRCVGSWGIDRLLQTPRRLDRYHEPSLRSRAVVYDEGGWPVHPDTMKRTVRLITKQMEFTLNIIFFVVLPCLLLWNALKLIISHFKKKQHKSAYENKRNPKKILSSHDMQVREALWRSRRRTKLLNKWMTPRADELSTDIWRNIFTEKGFSASDCMRPLLRDQQFRGKLYELQSSMVDSEHDDTEYVLLQMQKSKESLAKNQEKSSDFSDTKN